MDGFERACEAAFLLAAHFSSVLDANDSIPNKQDCQEDSDDMLEAAAKLNLYYYVKSKLERDPGRVKGSTYGLLHQALQAQYMKKFFPPKFRLLFWDGYARMMASEPDERIVGLLLDYKADPNQRLGTIGERTPFTAFVERFEWNWRDWPAWKQERLFRVLKLLLQRGANPMLKKSDLRRYDKHAAHDVEPDDMGEVSVVEYLSYTLDHSRTVELGGLVDSILNKPRTKSAGWYPRCCNGPSGSELSFFPRFRPVKGEPRRRQKLAPAAHARECDGNAILV
ncbi:hypothetical protein GE09DRAFT_754858 [Coniochaeta sp. 2T2.1]|nr:hypothetical protein GE09DRAFT_754858 [Coniochaeta sp. 2T2.1]